MSFLRGRSSRLLTVGAVAVLVAGSFGAGLAVGDDAASRPSVFSAGPVLRPVHGQGYDGFAAIGDVVVFAGVTESHGRELWRTDGTKRGTRLVRDIFPGEHSSDPFGVPLGDIFVFAAKDGRHGQELWRSDGTRRGTYLLEDIKPRGKGRTLWWSFSSATDDGRVFFRVLFTTDDGRHGEELWITDGTGVGTHVVRDIDRPTGESNVFRAQPREMTVLGRRVFFTASDGEHGFELWVSDGTEGGTGMLADVDRRASRHRNRSGPASLTAAGDRLFFVADDGIHGRELWVSDGTADGTTMVHEIAPGRRSARVEQLAAFGDRVVFSATDGTHGKEPWSSDGTSDGTVRLADIADGDRSSLPYQPVVIGDRVVFTAHDADKQAELWITDGSASGTRLVKEFPSDTPCGVAPVAAIGGIAFLRGCTLWETDGTARGTIKVDGGPHPSFEFGVLGDVLFMWNEETSGTAALWAATPITHEDG
jgi:ELWxxDGT repeat protein